MLYLIGVCVTRLQVQVGLKVLNEQFMSVSNGSGLIPSFAGTGLQKTGPVHTLSFY